MTQCQSCKSAVPTGAAFCASCGMAVSPPPRFGEKVYFVTTNLKVTNSRLVIGDTTYKMANITSFCFKSSPSAFTILGGGLVLLGLVVAAAHRDASGIAWGVLLATLGGVLAIRSGDHYHLEIVTNAGTATVFKSTDSKLVMKLRQAMNAAIGERA
jgi:hypothetical protein